MEDIARRRAVLETARAADLLEDGEYETRKAALRAEAQLLLGVLPGALDGRSVTERAWAAVEADIAERARDQRYVPCCAALLTPSAGAAAGPSAGTAGSAVGRAGAAAAAAARAREAELKERLGVKKPAVHAPPGQPGLGGHGFVAHKLLLGTMVAVPLPQPKVAPLECKGAPACPFRTASKAGLAGHERACKRAQRAELLAAGADDAAAASGSAPARGVAAQPGLAAAFTTGARRLLLKRLRPIQDSLTAFMEEEDGFVLDSLLQEWRQNSPLGDTPEDFSDLSMALLSIAVWDEVQEGWSLREEEVDVVEYIFVEGVRVRRGLVAAGHAATAHRRTWCTRVATAVRAQRSARAQRERAPQARCPVL
jgi:hypothetical protein